MGRNGTASRIQRRHGLIQQDFDVGTSNLECIFILSKSMSPPNLIDVSVCGGQTCGPTFGKGLRVIGCCCLTSYLARRRTHREHYVLVLSLA
jgi:hypothetical protein